MDEFRDWMELKGARNKLDLSSLRMTERAPEQPVSLEMLLIM